MKEVKINGNMFSFSDEDIAWIIAAYGPICTTKTDEDLRVAISDLTTGNYDIAKQCGLTIAQGFMNLERSAAIYTLILEARKEKK